MTKRLQYLKPRIPSPRIRSGIRRVSNDYSKGGRKGWKVSVETRESSGYDSIKAARLCTFPVILSKLAAKVIGKRQRGWEGAPLTKKRRCAGNTPSSASLIPSRDPSNQPRLLFPKEAPLTFKWLLPAKQCRNFLSVFHISSAIPFLLPSSFSPPTFPRTALSLSLFPSFLSRVHCPEKSRSFPLSRHGISSVSSRNLLILDES